MSGSRLSAGQMSDFSITIFYKTYNHLCLLSFMIVIFFLNDSA